MTIYNQKEAFEMEDELIVRALKYIPPEIRPLYAAAPALLAERDRLREELKLAREALQDLCDAEEQYGDETNVAVNQAWGKARAALERMK